jgi:hypothetical protein
MMAAPTCECCQLGSNLGQQMHELDFERGIWGAALQNDRPRVKRLLDNGTHANARDYAGYTALHYAAR